MDILGHNNEGDLWVLETILLRCNSPRYDPPPNYADPLLHINHSSLLVQQCFTELFRVHTSHGGHEDLGSGWEAMLQATRTQQRQRERTSHSKNNRESEKIQMN